MIKLSKYSTVIYIDHETNLATTTKTKLNTTNINKFNLKLIRVSTYFFQFRLNVRHRSKKFNIVSNALSKLSIKKTSNKKNNLEINADDSKSDNVYAYAVILIEMSSEFREKIIEKYSKNLS